MSDHNLKIAEIIAQRCKAFVVSSLAPIIARLTAVEALKVVPGRDGTDGAPGRDGEPGSVGLDGKDGSPGRDGIDGAAGKDGEPGRDGEPGLDGKDGRDGVDGQPGKDGRDGLDGTNGADGKDGEPGRDGEPGLDGKDGSPGRDGIDGAPGKDGRDGDPGRDGEPGVDGKDGRDGVDGKDADPADLAGVTASIEAAVKMLTASIEAVKAENAELRVKLAALEARPLPVDGKDGSPGTDGRDGRDGSPGRDGKDGSNGLDGRGIANVEHAMTNDRLWSIKTLFTDGSADTQELRAVGMIRDAGVWRPKTYEAGDGVTCNGSFWFAQKDTSERPGSSAGAWRLAVKRGRDAREAS